MADRDYESEAREQGWRPQEEFRGNKDKWVDAKTYVERRETVMPLIKEENADLRARLTEANTRVLNLEKAVKENTEAMAAIQEMHAEDKKRALKEQKETLTAQLKQAREDGNLEVEIQLQDQLTDVRDQIKEADKPAAKPKVEDSDPVDPEQQPDFLAWKADNADWFGVDQERTEYAMRAAQHLRIDHPRTFGRKFFDLVTQAVEEKFNGAPPADKTEAGGRHNGGRGGSGKGKTWADLPADAKAGAEKFRSKVVGPNKQYKTDKEYNEYYANMYFAGAE